MSLHTRYTIVSVFHICYSFCYSHLLQVRFASITHLLHMRYFHVRCSYTYPFPVASATQLFHIRYTESVIQTLHNRYKTGSQPFHITVSQPVHITFSQPSHIRYKTVSHPLQGPFHDTPVTHPFHNCFTSVTHQLHTSYFHVRYTSVTGPF